MKYCKVYLNSESEEVQKRKGLYVIGEVIETKVYYEKWKNNQGHQKKPVWRKKKRTIYTVKPLENIEGITPDYYIEARYAKFTKHLEETTIKQSHYAKTLDLVN